MSKHHGRVSCHGSNHNGEWTVWDMMIIQLDVQVMDSVLLWNKTETIESIVHFLYEAVFVTTRRCAHAGVQSSFGAIVGHRESTSFVDLQELKFKNHTYNVLLEYCKILPKRSAMDKRF